jgi:hypothetical protein
MIDTATATASPPPSLPSLPLARQATLVIGEEVRAIDVRLGGDGALPDVHGPYRLPDLVAEVVRTDTDHESVGEASDALEIALGQALPLLPVMKRSGVWELALTLLERGVRTGYAYGRTEACALEGLAAWKQAVEVYLASTGCDPAAHEAQEVASVRRLAKALQTLH